MAELELLQDYFAILEQCKDPEEVFRDKPAEREFAWLWVLKLCLDIYKGPEAKRLRNTYLLELSQCIDNVELSPMFMRLPPNGRLPPFAGASNINVDKKAVVREMQAAAAECMPLVSPRNYHTHLSDPRDGPIWSQMGSQEPFGLDNECEEVDVGDEEDANVNMSFGEFCLDAVIKELSGRAKPDECPELEEQLEKYEEFIQDYPAGEKAKHYRGNGLRTFLLLNLQTNLVKALRSV